MKIWLVKAKPGRRVMLPRNGAEALVPSEHEADFPDSPELQRERDIHGDLESCRLFEAVQPDVKKEAEKPATTKQKEGN